MVASGALVARTVMTASRLAWFASSSEERNWEVPMGNLASVMTVVHGARAVPKPTGFVCGDGTEHPGF